VENLVHIDPSVVAKQLEIMSGARHKEPPITVLMARRHLTGRELYYFIDFLTACCYDIPGETLFKLCLGEFIRLPFGMGQLLV
jgi:hypothetical protein